MAIKTISVLAATWFVPKSEKDDMNPARFEVRPLDGMQYMEVMNETSGTGVDLRISGRGLKLALQHGLVGWETVQDKDGKNIEFSRNEVNRLPPILLTELAAEILDISELGEEAIKN